jgi:hypothetical protein
MKLSNDIVIFVGIIIVSLVIAYVASALAVPKTDIPDNVIKGNITSMRAIEGGESNTRVDETNGRYISRTVTMLYSIQVDIQGGGTYSYSGYLGRRGDIDVVYDTNLDSKGINLQKMAAIQDYAMQRWNYSMQNGNVIWQPYSKGS